MFDRRKRQSWLLVLLLAATVVLTACSDTNTLYVPDLLASAQQYNGKDITVSGAYLEKPGLSVLVLGVSTLDNGLDAQPLGDQIWVDGFPQAISAELHRPGDSTYGFVRVSGRFQSGGTYGPEGNYTHHLQVTAAEPIERVRRNEVRIENKPLEQGKVSFFELANNPGQYNGQSVTTQGYYFWNGVIYVLAEGVSTEEDGSSPQPVGKTFWMEGFPPDESGKLNVGPNNSFVWGLVEVTGNFQSGGGFGKDGAYTELLNVTSAQALPQK